MMARSPVWTQPLLVDGRRGRDRVAPVLAELRGRPEAELAVRRDAHLDAGTRPPDRVQRLVVVGVERRGETHAARLGRRVADRVRSTEPRTRLAHQRRRRHRATDDQRLHARQVELVEQRRPQQQRDLRRDAADGRHAMRRRRLAARRRRASAPARRCGSPVRRYQGSFVITPMWANCVDASSGPPPPHSPALGPRSMSVIAASSR